MPVNILTKLESKKVFNSEVWIYYLLKTFIKLNSLLRHNWGINYEKKSNGNGPKVFDSESFSSYWHVIKIPSPRPLSDLT